MYDILEELNLQTPKSVMSSPSELGLYYIPPSGKKNGGAVRNYNLSNINRDLFDEWLQIEAKKSGVEILFNNDFLEFKERTDAIAFTIKNEGKVKQLSTKFLIGADGVCSKVRKILCPEFRMELMMVIQEYWKSNRKLENYFYMLFNGDITSNYSYIIPKDDCYIVGTGTPYRSSASAQTCLRKFKAWLGKEFDFKPLGIMAKEAGFIPIRDQVIGKGNVALVGDAAGLCNYLSGEGIRHAIASGITAAEVISQNQDSKNISKLYASQIEALCSFVRGTYDFGANFTDPLREDFVISELAR